MRARTARLSFRSGRRLSDLFAKGLLRGVARRLHYFNPFSASSMLSSDFRTAEGNVTAYF